MKQLIYVGLFICACVSCVSPSGENAQQKELPHVLVIGVDGMGAHAFSMGQNLPHFDFLMQNGAYSLEARTIMPSVSAPAWTTLFTGTTPERHSAGDNDWRVHNRPMEPIYKNEFDMFPTMFAEIRVRYPEAVLGAIYHWGTIGELIEKGVCDLSISADSEDEAIRKTGDFIAEKKPNLTLVHVDHQDHAGHSEGYRSDAYVRATLKTDSLVGALMESLRKADLFDQTFIFVVADHGGFKTGHGNARREEMEVPFFIYGPGVKKGYRIAHPVFNYDLAPTIEWLFEVEPNEWVVGKPLKDAFSW